MTIEYDGEIIEEYAGEIYVIGMENKPLKSMKEYEMLVAIEKRKTKRIIAASFHYSTLLMLFVAILFAVYVIGKGTVSFVSGWMTVIAMCLGMLWLHLNRDRY